MPQMFGQWATASVSAAQSAKLGHMWFFLGRWVFPEVQESTKLAPVSRSEPSPLQRVETLIDWCVVLWCIYLELIAVRD